MKIFIPITIALSALMLHSHGRSICAPARHAAPDVDIHQSSSQAPPIIVDGTTAPSIVKTSAATHFSWSNGTNSTTSTGTPGTHLQVPNAQHASPVKGQSSHLTATDYCIDFTFDNSNYYYRLDAPWGPKTGTFGSLPNGRMCLPRSDQKGGAMFIGAHPNPTANSTKFECYFGINSGMTNCDMSIVDGFSLPVSCTMGHQSMGGLIDLWSTGAQCPNESLKHLGICTNNREEHGESRVSSFFQPAINNGHSYCIETGCRQNPYFPIETPMKCHVGSTKLSRSR